MKRQPEIRIDEDGTTWALLGVHGGKAYYGNVTKLQEAIEIPAVIYTPEPQTTAHPQHFAYTITTPHRPIRITDQ